MSTEVDQVKTLEPRIVRCGYHLENGWLVLVPMGKGADAYYSAIPRQRCHFSKSEAMDFLNGKLARY
jgi:hypothetical protein